MNGKVRKPFAMKLFSIAHDNVALPVTSDACLFGAMIQLSKPQKPGIQQRVLEIGTGTGLLCFMLAQKHPGASFIGIDIHEESVIQAKENLQNNPFAQRICFELGEILQYSPKDLFQHIVCNPPFFENQLPSQNDTRRLARHSDSLNLNSLLQACYALLEPEGELFLLYPCDDLVNSVTALFRQQFQPRKITFIQANDQKKPHLMMIHAQKCNDIEPSITEITQETIVHYEPNGKLTKDATHYLQEFYSHLP